jgi:hypothetical protein
MRVARRQVLPLALVLAVLFVGLNRLILLGALTRYPPGLSHPLNAASLLAFWEFWFVQHGSVASVQRSLMIVNVLLVVFVWVRFRALPRETFSLRLFQLATFGGIAALLAYLQYYLVCVSLVEPGFRIYKLELGSGVVTLF